MSRRRLMAAGGPRRGAGAGRGLSGPRRARRSPRPCRPPIGPAQAGVGRRPAAAGRGVADACPAKPAVRISPESFTITADDPGLQLLAAETRRSRPAI